jgi:hypothetical protein
MRRCSNPGHSAEGLWAITWVIVLSTDPLPKPEANVDRARNRSLVVPGDMERPIEMQNLAPMKEDLPWNRCC